MTDATLAPSQWLETLRKEYLAEFIAEGGGTVKFAVCLDTSAKERILNELASVAKLEGYLVTKVDASQVRIGAMDNVFHEIAKQIEWHFVTESALRLIAKDLHYTIPEATDPSIGFGQQLAQMNGMSGTETVDIKMEAGIRTRVSLDHRMFRDFRVAMTGLCLDGLASGVLGDGHPIVDWLTGHTTTTGGVKRFRIYSRITRSNARFHLQSLCHWLHQVGHKGLIVIMDISRLHEGRTSDGLVRYTRPGILDAYEVLREWIDGADQLSRCLLVVISDQQLLDLEPLGKGLGAYQALKLRVYDEIRDSRLANPVAALVRITGGPQ